MLALTYLVMVRDEFISRFKSRQRGSNRPGFLLNLTTDKLYDRSLRGSLRVASERTGIDFGIIILEQLPDGATIESQADLAFSQYSIGKRQEGKGILFLLAKKERTLKIEVSYALEGVFPDVTCRRLEQGARTYMLTGNTRDFLTELLVTMGIHYREYQKGQIMGDIEFPLPPESNGLTRYLSGGAGVIGRGYAATLEQLISEVGRVPTSDMRFQPEESPHATMRNYYTSLREGIGDSNLPLLTPGSRYFRREMPMGKGFLQRTLAYYERAGGYQIFESGTLAVAVYPPNNPVFPILFRRNEAGKWLIDEAGAWAHFHRFEDGSDFFPKYENNPYLFGYRKARHPILAHTLYKQRSKGALPLEDTTQLIPNIKRLEENLLQNPKNASAYFELGDLLFFECYWRKAALALIEKGLELDPSNVKYTWRLLDLQLSLFPIEPVLKTMRRIVQLTPEDTLAGEWLKKYRSVYEE